MIALTASRETLVNQCTCFIIPKDVLDRFSGDKKLSAELRKASADTSRVSTELRKLRTQAGALTTASRSLGAHLVDLAASPKVSVYDCKHSQTLPGTPIANPKASKDATIKRTFSETTQVAQFYKKVFNRNSIDDAGMTMMSSVHFGVNFNNIGCEDPFGSLERQTILNRLVEIYSQRQSAPIMSTAGAGMGLKFMIENCANFYMFCEKRKRSIVACTFLLEGRRKNIGQANHLHISVR